MRKNKKIIISCSCKFIETIINLKMDTPPVYKAPEPFKYNLMINNNKYDDGWYANQKNNSKFCKDFAKLNINNEEELNKCLYRNSLKLLPWLNYIKDDDLKNVKIHVPL